MCVCVCRGRDGWKVIKTRAVKTVQYSAALTQASRLETTSSCIHDEHACNAIIRAQCAAIFWDTAFKKTVGVNYTQKRGQGRICGGVELRMCHTC